MAMTNQNLAWDFRIPAIESGTLHLNRFRGHVLLVANTASFCGYTYQYDGREKLHAACAADGLSAFPS